MPSRGNVTDDSPEEFQARISNPTGKKIDQRCHFWYYMHGFIWYYNNNFCHIGLAPTNYWLQEVTRAEVIMFRVIYFGSKAAGPVRRNVCHGFNAWNVRKAMEGT